jgi:signal transduction histidine kinase/CheY-like chemotaxis protein
VSLREYHHKALHEGLREAIGQIAQASRVFVSNIGDALRWPIGPEPEIPVRVFYETLSRLQGITAAASDGQTIEEVSRALLVQGINSLGATSGGVFMLDDAGLNLELRGSVGYGEGDDLRYRVVALARKLPLTDAFNQGRSIMLDSPEEIASHYPEVAQQHPELTLWSLACIPLELDGRPVGVMGLGFPPHWTFTSDDRAFLDALATRCAQVLERTRVSAAEPHARRRAERSASQLARLHAFTEALAQAITLAQVIEAVVDLALPAPSARSGQLWLLSDDGATVRLARSVGTAEPTPDGDVEIPTDIPWGSPIVDAIRSGTTIWIESRGQLKERYPSAVRALRDDGECSRAYLPLFAQGRCIGGLVFDYDGVHRFLEDERAFLQVLAWHSAQAIERSHLYASEKAAREAAEANHHRSEFLADTGTLLASSLDYVSTLASVARLAVPRIADWCIVELEESRLAGVPAAAAHNDPSRLHFVQELSGRFRELSDGERGIPGVMRSGKSELCQFTSMARRGADEADPEVMRCGRQAGVGSTIIVPICAHGQTIGAILFTRAGDGRPYGKRDLAMAEELGRRAGIAIDNARLYRDARVADQRKDEFLAMLGHELRNPLAPILTALELMDLRGGEVFAQERTIIGRQVKHVVRLVDDLLDVARITSGKITLRREHFEVAEAIADAVETASPLLEQRLHDLHLAVPPSGLPVMADRGRLTQAIANLLTNAAKYTEPRGRVALTAAREGGEVVVRVRDSGIGIAPQTLPHVFDLFVQEKGSLDRAQGGLGIGLTIVRSLVHLLGGSVLALSEGLGRGSEFVVRLPVGPDHPPVSTGAMTKLDGGRAQGAPLRVLIVDDNADAARMFSTLLEAFGYATHVATDGPSALAAAPTFRPEVALLDIGLPVMDGYELARQLRQMDTASPTWLVAITGYGQAADRRSAHEAGFDEHLVKPVNVDALLGILRRLDAAAGES